MAGQSYIGHIPAEWIAGWVADESFAPTADMRRMAEADALLICVPTPLSDSRDPDLLYVEATARQIAAVSAARPTGRAGKHDLSQHHPGRGAADPGTERADRRARISFWPTAPNAKIRAIPNYSASGIPKVVGGIEPPAPSWPSCFTARRSSTVVPVSSCEVAEACKILENTYRAVNIALVNELKMLYDRMGIDVWEVIDAAKTKPFGFQAFYPGPGWAGTAFRSIRSISPGWPASTACPRGSSSWPAKSTPACRSTSSSG